MFSVTTDEREERPHALCHVNLVAFRAHSNLLQKEKNLMLEEKITTLQQENEDLHVRGRNQTVVSR